MVAEYSDLRYIDGPDIKAGAEAAGAKSFIVDGQLNSIASGSCGLKSVRPQDPCIIGLVVVILNGRKFHIRIKADYQGFGEPVAAP